MHNGLITSLNALRELSSDIYHKYIPEITADTDIASLAQPILTVPQVYNEFCSALINRIVYTQFTNKIFRNPLKMLEGDKLPLGFAGENVYTNPAKGRQFNVNDFAGLLMKYEIDAKVEYHKINCDVQYPVTISREQLKKAFVSWNELETFINNVTNSLYNGCYIDEYNRTKQLVAGAYKENRVIIEQVTAVSSEATGKSFVEKCRELYLNFQLPSTKYNAWHKFDGMGRPITTWTNPEDIVLIIRNDVLTKIDVNVLAAAFNLSYADFMGRVINVDNFDVYNDDGTKNYDGSAIQALICDKAFFQIKTQDMFMDEFYNANNRTMQFYLNSIKMYGTSLFANAVVLATSIPSINYTALSYGDATTIEVYGTEGLDLIGTPAGANATITYASGSTSVFTVAKDSNNDRHCVITGVGTGTATLTVSAPSASDLTVTIDVKEV